jgi:hypothetical protein
MENDEGATMSANQTERIVCEKCGRSGPYRPELAGKRLKCKCGNIIRVPEAPMEPEPDPADDFSEPVRLEPLAAEPPQPPVESPLPRAPAPSMYPTFSRARPVQDEKSGLMRMVVLIVVLGVLIGGAIVGIKMLSGPDRPAGPQLGEDADIEQKMQDEYHKEVRAWFAEDHTRILGPWTETQALAQVDRWQKMGAKQVIAFSSRLSMVAVIELPDDPAQRKQLFDWQASWNVSHMQKVWTDVGQKYLMIQLGV